MFDIFLGVVAMLYGAVFLGKGVFWCLVERGYFCEDWYNHYTSLFSDDDQD